MSDKYKIEITLNGENLVFDASIDKIGFVHKIYISISDVVVTFEPDEERKYRGVVNPLQQRTLSEKDKQIIEAIGKSLAKLLN